MSDWTPGPWAVREVDSDIGAVLAVVDPEKIAGDAICFVTRLRDEGPTDRSNANLIASSPALLHALEQIIDRLLVTEEDYGGKEIWRDAFDAIALARGVNA